MNRPRVSLFSVLFALMVLFMVVGVFLGFQESRKTDRAIKTLEAMGFSDIEVQDPLWLTPLICREGSAAYPARAKNAAGRTAELLVCCHPFHGCDVKVP